jgi:replicative DNA helicase
MIDAPQTISDLETSMTLLVAKYGCQIVMVDHLHELLGDKHQRGQNSDEKYGEFMERICATTKKLDVATILYAQYSRKCEEEGRKPEMRDLKGSSAIEQKARRIFQFYKDPETGHFAYEGSKYSNSGWGNKADRVVSMRYARDHDGFEVIGH